MSPLFTLCDVTTESPSFIQSLSWWRYFWREPRTKQYAWSAMLRWNAIVIQQIYGRIWHQALSAMISAMNEWRMAQTLCFVYYTLTKVRTMLAVFSASAVSLYDDCEHTNIISSCSENHLINHFIYRLIWENYHHISDIWYDITYTAAASSSRQPVKIKVWFNVKKLCQKYILLFSSLKGAVCRIDCQYCSPNSKYWRRFFSPAPPPQTWLARKMPD